MAITKKQKNQKTSPRAADAAAATKSQSQKSNVEKESMPMGKVNYILMGVSLLLIVIGFVLMSGSSNEGATFNYDVFNSTRIVVAPFITFVGFLCMIPAILYKGKKDEDTITGDAKDEAPTSNIIVNSK
ncbi:MAG: DUF3098 domain-containing protein [Muribaculaceae bacterium]|nr:DUF3098 domain-containing protein [Muribaculaceae bacterium]